jgi:hypothetical protein
MIAAGVAVVVVAVVAVVLLTRHPGASPNAGPTVRPTRATTPSHTPTASPTPNYVQLRATPEGTAAVALAGLLNQAESGLGNVSGARTNVLDCKPKLATDKQTFFSAADERRGLLLSLARLPHGTALPAALVADLAGGWQAENDEYSLLGLWASSAADQGCHTKTIKNNGYLLDSYGHENQATAAMKKFVRLWDPIAARYSLASYEYWKI